MKRSAAAVLIAVIVIALVFVMSVYTIDQRKAAIKFQLGEVIAVQTDPGLYFMVPVLQNVRLYDTRIQTLEAREYYRSVQGDALKAEARLAQTVNDALRAEFAKRTVHDVVSGEREKIMSTVAERVDQDVRRIGVAVVDVRLKRVDFVPEISSDVFRRMESERKRVANELRATG